MAYTKFTWVDDSSVITAARLQNIEDEVDGIADGAYTFAGAKTFSSNIAMSTKKLTGLGAGSTNGDSVRYEQVARLVDAQTIAGLKTFSNAIIISDGAGNYIQFPKLTTTQRDALSPINGMIIYNSTTNAFNFYENGSWGIIIDHSALSNLAWSVAGHSIDATLDMNNNSIDELNSIDFDATSDGIFSMNTTTMMTFENDASAITLNKPFAMGGNDITGVGLLNFGSPVELTISSGIITVTDSYHIVDTEGDAGTDDLDTINGGVQGDILIIRTADNGRDVTAKDLPAGNLHLAGDFAMTTVADMLMLIRGPSQWHELSRSDNA